MSSTPRSTIAGQQALGVVARPAGVGVDPDRAAEDLADGAQRLEVLRPAALDLERREVGGPGGSLGDDRRLVDADGEVGRRDVGRQADQLVDRDAEDLAGEVVEGDVERALGRAIPADVGRPRRADACELPPAASRVVQIGGEPRRSTGAAARPRPSSRASRRRTGPGSPPPPRRRPGIGRRAARRSTVVTPSPTAWSVRAIRNGSRRRGAAPRGVTVRLIPATHGSASTRLADRRPEPLRAEPERVVGRQPGLRRGRGDDPIAPRRRRDRATC